MRGKKGFLSLFFVLQSLCTVVSVEEDVTGRGGLLLFGELASWKRVGFSVRGEQPPGTERHRGREAHLSINIREKGQLEIDRAAPRVKTVYDGLGGDDYDCDDHLDKRAAEVKRRSSIPRTQLLLHEGLLLLLLLPVLLHQLGLYRIPCKLSIFCSTKLMQLTELYSA